MISVQRIIPCTLVATLLLASSTFAQTGPELMLKPFPKELRLDLNASAWISNAGHSKETDQSLQVGIYETEGRLRLTPDDLTSPRIGFGFKYFNIDSHVKGLPDQTFDQSFGFAMPIGKFDDWVIGLSVGVGYAGETPFGDGNGWYGRAGLVAFKQLDDTSALAIVFDYDGNRYFRPDLPLPGFAYIKRIQSNLSLTVGLPVTSIEWQPVKDVRVEVGFVLTGDVTARVGYEFAKGLEVFGALGQRTDAFFLQNQRYGDDRLLFQQRNVELGMTYRLRDAGVGDKDLEVTAAVGYAFSGEFSVGYDSENSRLIADVSDEPYVRFAMQMRF